MNCNKKRRSLLCIDENDKDYENETDNHIEDDSRKSKSVLSYGMGVRGLGSSNTIITPK